MRKCDEYRTTTNSNLYRKLHKEMHASCSYCSWHQRHWDGYSENDHWKYYQVNNYPKKPNRYPNWKLVSKNSKQWMPKGLKYRKSRHWHRDWEYYSIEWHV